MSVKEIETAITNLSAQEIAELAAWFAEHHARVWDEQIEHDLESGRLEKVIAEVEAEYKAGTAKPL